MAFLPVILQAPYFMSGLGPNRGREPNATESLKQADWELRLLDYELNLSA